MKPTEKENPDLKAPEAVIKGKGKGKKDAARDTEDVKAAQADVIGEGKGKCEHHEKTIEAAATVEVAKKLEGLHLVEGDISPWKNNQTLDKNTAQLMQTLKQDILEISNDTIPKTVEGWIKCCSLLRGCKIVCFPQRNPQCEYTSK